MKKVKIINDGAPAGIGSTIFRGLHCLYYQKADELLYFHFTNDCYGDKDENVWSLYLPQPCIADKEYIISQYNSGNAISTTINFAQDIPDKFFLWYHGIDWTSPVMVERLRVLTAKYIRFHQPIMDKYNEFYTENFAGRRILAVQKRGGMHLINGHAAGQSHLWTPQHAVDITVAEFDKNGYDAVFLATDEAEAVDAFTLRFGKKLIHRASIVYRDHKDHSVNHGLFDLNKKHLAGEEAIIDMLLLAKADYHLCVRSNISLLSILFRENYEFRFIDDHIHYR